MLEAAAVVPARAERWLLEALAGPDLPQLETCLAAGMLHSDGAVVGFRHEIARLAHHAEGAADGPAVLVHAAAAGHRAARLGAHREAADQYARALRQAGGLPAGERSSLLERRA